MGNHEYDDNATRDFSLPNGGFQPFTGWQDTARPFLLCVETVDPTLAREIEQEWQAGNPEPLRYEASLEDCRTVCRALSSAATLTPPSDELLATLRGDAEYGCPPSE